MSAADADERLLALLDSAPPAGHGVGRGWRDLIDTGSGASGSGTSGDRVSGGRVSGDGVSGNGAAGGGSDRGRVQDLWESSRGAGGYDTLLAAGVRMHTWVPGFAGGATLRSFVDVAGRLGLSGGETVLDLACGPGTLTRRLADAVGPSGLVIGADLSAPMLDRAARALRHPQVTLARVDAMDLPLADDTVDAVCCSLCLHLVPDLDVALDEILRVLRPGGTMALAVPARGRGAQRLLTEPLGRGGQFHLFAPGELAGALRRHGVSSIRTRHDHVVQLLDARV